MLRVTELTHTSTPHSKPTKERTKNVVTFHEAYGIIYDEEEKREDASKSSCPLALRQATTHAISGLPGIYQLRCSDGRSRGRRTLRSIWQRFAMALPKGRVLERHHQLGLSEDCRRKASLRANQRSFSHVLLSSSRARRAPTCSIAGFLNHCNPLTADGERASAEQQVRSLHSISQVTERVPAMTTEISPEPTAPTTTWNEV